MARQARVKSETGIYHVMLRGINKQDIFIDDEDFKRFLDTITYCKKKSHFELYAFCLMSNHIHLLIKENETDISTVIKQIGCSFVYWYNKKYERVGHLFQDRFLSEPVENDEYFLTVLRYIHQNPVKAGLVKKCEEYPYSSYKLYFIESTLINKQFALRIMNVDQYKSFHLITAEDVCLELPPDNVRINDSKAKKIYIDVMKDSSEQEFSALDTVKQKELLKKLKTIGLSIPQIASLTGLKKSRIESVIYSKSI